MKKTVTIGIPSYNEENNIYRIVNDVFKQETSEFTTKEVIVLSDGSSDNTIKEVSKIKNKKLKIIDSTDRLGKPARMNQIFEMSNSDIVIILDADIQFASPQTLYKLVKPMLANSDIQLSSGVIKPKKPVTYIQKIAEIGIDIWYDCRMLNNPTGLYWCDGSLRAFGKKLYKQIRFPNASADEAFSYLYCVGKGYEFISVKNSVGNNILPSTLSDYIHQIKRYLLSEPIQKNNFDEEFVSKHYTIGFALKNLVLMKYLVNKPVLTSLYLFISFLARLSYIIDPNDEVKWQIITSTKLL